METLHVLPHVYYSHDEIERICQTNIGIYKSLKYIGYKMRLKKTHILSLSRVVKSFGGRLHLQFGVVQEDKGFLVFKVLYQCLVNSVAEAKSYRYFPDEAMLASVTYYECRVQPPKIGGQYPRFVIYQHEVIIDPEFVADHRQKNS
jgi:hypothetical protein